MKNVIFIITPEKTKLELNNNLQANGVFTPIESKIGGSENLRFIRKTSTSILDVHYIENAYIDGSIILPSKKGDEDTRSVIILAPEPIESIESHLQGKIDELFFCVLNAKNDNTEFSIGENYVVFNVKTANAVFL